MPDNKTKNIAKRPAFLMFLVAMVSACVILVEFGKVHWTFMSPTHYLFAIADSLVILVPYWFLKGRWRWTVVIPVWLLGVFALCSSVYFRIFADVIPFGAFLFWNNVNGLVTDNVVPFLKWTDMMYLIIPFVCMLWYILNSKGIRSEDPFSGRVKMIALSISVLLMIVCQIRFVQNEYRTYRRLTGNNAEDLRTWVKKQYTVMPFSRYKDISTIGFTGYVIKRAVSSLHIAIKKGKLSDSEMKAVSSFLSETKIRNAGFKEEPKKNVVFIVVESLNSWAIGRTYGDRKISMTPVLDSLMASEDVYYALNVQPQVCAGTSSDGQLMYNTGLLPLRDDVVAMNYCDNKFIGLPMLLERDYSFEVICESPVCWNHDKTNRNYGYDHLFSKFDLDSFASLLPSKNGKDGLMFDFALDRMEHIKGSFFAFLTTISMHIPYNDRSVTRVNFIDDLPGISQTHKDYLQMLWCFDEQLGSFINRMKSLGFYDDTMIFIASDHNMLVSDTMLPGSYSPIAFFAINAGIGGCNDKPVGQIDIFPTILDLCGVSDDGKWRGVGRSMLEMDLKTSVGPSGKVYGRDADSIVKRQAEAWDISQKIIEGNYFDKIDAGSLGWK